MTAHLIKVNCKLFLTYILIAIPFLLFSQEREKTYSFNFNNTPLVKVFEQVEKVSSVKFYYQPSDLDGVFVSKSISNSTLNNVVKEVLSNTAINFFVYDESFFLTKGIRLDISNLKQENDIANRQLPSTNTVDGAKVFNKLYEVGIRNNNTKVGTAAVVGYVLDEATKNPIPGAKISSADNKINVTSDSAGLYIITLPLGLNYLTITAVEYKMAKRQVMIYGDGKLNLEIKQNVEMLREINILSQRSSALKNLEMGVNKLTIASIKQVPAVFGEPDILRVVLTLPGVQSVGEASTGFNVRGGSVDNNLILLDNSTIYNPSHFFGFFSAFNPDVVKEVQLYKSTIPERFGGRLASVLEVQNREGDKTKLKGSAGIGMITSRFSVEAPIDSGRTSFILAGRGTYSNWLLDLLPAEYKNSRASFYDLNFGISHKLDDRNDLNLTAYTSRDNFKLNSDTSYNYTNRNLSFEWRKRINPRLRASFKAALDNYAYKIESDANLVNAYTLKFNVGQANVKADFKYIFNDNHILNFGISSIGYNIQPGKFDPLGGTSLVQKETLQEEKALETALYFGDEFKVNERLTVNLGLRYSIYNMLGPRVLNVYAEGQPKTDVNILSTESYSNNRIIKTYQSPEIRLAGRYSFTDDLSLKASYNTLIQYIHLLSNTTAVAPTDVWKLSDPNISPQKGSQVSLGIYRTFASKTIETSVETYFKRLRDFLDYKSGATLIMNQAIEQDVIKTNGKAYGVEFFVKKTTGKLNGWVSYAYSKVLLKMDDITEGPLVNGGQYYPANYDKPHSFNFTGNYKIKQRYHFSLNFTYSTGRPITLPIAKYYYAGSERVYYSDRNSYRVPDYLRMDVSLNIEGNHKVKQLLHNSWTFGVYNVTGRRNVFSTFFTQDSGVINGYNLSIFATAIPFVNYNIRF
ncbi:TonB-dependent receptor [Pedobacter sp.]